MPGLGHWQDHRINEPAGAGKLLHRMRRNLAEALDVDVKQVSVKARSNDGIGEEGQGRACAAWATVLIYPASD